jgi:hypothetical protein
MAAGMSRRSEALLALLVALIAALSALAGAYVGGYATNKAATKQIQAQREQSRVDFIRSQEQSAYAAFLGDAFELLRLQGNYFGDILVNDNGQAHAGDVAISQFDRLSSELALVEIIGSPRVRKVAQALVDEFLDASNRLVGLAIALPRPVSRTSQRALEDQTGRISGLVTAFQDAARADVRGS